MRAVLHTHSIQACKTLRERPDIFRVMLQTTSDDQMTGFKGNCGAHCSSGVRKRIMVHVAKHIAAEIAEELPEQPTPATPSL